MNEGIQKSDRPKDTRGILTAENSIVTERPPHIRQPTSSSPFLRRQLGEIDLSPVKKQNTVCPVCEKELPVDAVQAVIGGSIYLICSNCAPKVNQEPTDSSKMPIKPIEPKEQTCPQ